MMVQSGDEDTEQVTGGRRGGWWRRPGNLLLSGSQWSGLMMIVPYVAADASQETTEF